MSGPQSPERPARDGETCTCGRPATIVYQTERFGDVPYCGIEGHDAPQDVPRCPDWCVQPSASRFHVHMSKPFAITAYMLIMQHLGEAPQIHLSTWQQDTPILTVSAAEARMLARLSTKAIATALRKAADLLDEITSGGAQ